MSKLCSRQSGPRTICVGFTLVESIISMLLVSTMLMAALNTFGVSRTGQYRINERNRGNLLAQTLMSEILGQHYEEPNATVKFGRERSENMASRAAWDDVDDYLMLKQMPKDSDGNVIPNTAGWTWIASIERVNPLDLSQTLGSETGVKRITVTVCHGDRAVVSWVAVRTNAR